jgi:hypothetical protein
MGSDWAFELKLDGFRALVDTHEAFESSVVEAGT